MKIKSKQVKDIVEELLSGFNVYINRGTLEVKTLLDPDKVYDNEELWQQEFRKLDSEWEDYIEIIPMPTWQSFRIMEAFVEEIQEIELRLELLKRLKMRRPFANFKVVVESSAYRQVWFDFRQAEWEEYVREQLEAEDFEIE